MVHFEPEIIPSEPDPDDTGVGRSYVVSTFLGFLRSATAERFLFRAPRVVLIHLGVVMKFIILFVLLLYIFLSSVESSEIQTDDMQFVVNDSANQKNIFLPEITVSAGRVTQKSTTSYSNLDATEIAKLHTASDLPMLLTFLPNLYSYSESGSGLGYSYLRIRGFDQAKIAVLINGMPLNDPESHLVYWVDLPDVASSAQDIQVQRGAGNSGLGFSPFGGAVNVATLKQSPFRLKFEVGYGSWNTRKRTLQFSSGELDNRWSVVGRYSKLNSNGYRKDSWVDLWSTYLSSIRKHSKGEDQFNIILGYEKLHLAYFGVPLDSIQQKSKWNPLSAPIPQTDNFYQPHYQWLSTYQLDKNLKYSHTVYVSQGKGSYIQWKPNEDLTEYGLGPFTIHSSTGSDSTITSADIVTEKWVAMEQMGYFPKMEYENKWGKWIGEVELRKNVSSHWGTVNWANQIPLHTEPTPEWYRWRGVKQYLGMSISSETPITSRLTTNSALTYRMIDYTLDQNVGRNVLLFPGHNVIANWNFFLPRIGMTYDAGNKIGLFRASVAQSAREPNQSQLFEASDGVLPNFKSYSGKSWEDPIAKPEQLTSLELGWKNIQQKFYSDVVMYYHMFRNEIVPIGGLNELGEPILGNAKSSYQIGLEMEGGVYLKEDLMWKGNVSFANAKFSNFTVYDQQLDSNWSTIGTVTTKLNGNQVPYIPSLLANSTLEYQWNSIQIWSTTRYSGEIVMNMRGDENLNQPPYSTTSIGLKYQIPKWQGKTFTVDARVENLFNRIYAAGGYFYEYPTPDGIVQVNEFYPGSPRNVWVGFSLTL